MIRRKVCMLGAFAVGKTSLVRRYVDDSFSDRYESTVGVKIHKKLLEQDGTATTLLLWDLHGDDEFQRVRMTYLRGASGILLVADGTRAGTLERAVALGDLARGALGDVPQLLLVNKFDLKDEWELQDEDLVALRERSWTVLTTSAKDGLGVADAFRALTERMIEP